MSVLSRKPLGGKAYGSIPHLPNSRLGPGDWSVHEGQARIATERTRDRHDRIIVTEKLDGSNVAVARIGEEIVALTRAGYLASTSPYAQHHHFVTWVKRRETLFANLLKDGERLSGEWLLQAHGTRYKVLLADELLVAFDLIEGKTRQPYDNFRDRIRDVLPVATVLSDGPPMSVEAAMAIIGDHGWHSALDPVEGAVWRVERRGAFDFMAKFVRPGKADGVLLPEMSGKDPVWNFPPSWIAEAVPA